MSTGQQVRAFVDISALQEGTGQLPQDYVAEVTALTAGTNVTHAFVPLRYQSQGQFPDGIDYIQHFISKRWTPLGIALLGSNKPIAAYQALFSPAFVVAKDTWPFDASNAIAQQCRASWNIL